MAGFSEIIGHEQIIEHLQNAIRLNKVSHAYILDGEEGSGKMLLASAFAQTLQCEQGGTEPCGKCHSCIQAESRNQPDIIRVTHEKPGSMWMISGISCAVTSSYVPTAVPGRFILWMKRKR